MKKNGKRYRKIQKEKQINNEIMNERKKKPFSRVSKKKQICYHCKNLSIQSGTSKLDLYKIGIPIPYVLINPVVVALPIYSMESVVGRFYLRLQKISEVEYECMDCKKRFPVEKVENISFLKENLETKHISFMSMEQVYTNLAKEGLAPVMYYQISEDEVKYVE